MPKRHEFSSKRAWLDALELWYAGQALVGLCSDGALHETFQDICDAAMQYGASMVDAYEEIELNRREELQQELRGPHDG